nr:shematrin-like protein 1 [Rhipicephalus microplus]
MRVEGRNAHISACILLTFATCAFTGHNGYPLGYSMAAPAKAGAYIASLASVSAVHHAPASGYGFVYGLGYGIRAIVFLTLATCAFAGYAGYLGYSIAAPAYTAYHVPLASVSAVHHAPAFGYDLGYSLGCGVPAYGYGLGSYGLSYGYGFGGLGYSTLFRKKWELLSQ